MIPKFKEATMDEKFPPEDVKRAARALREHFQKHRDPMCERCQLWLAFLDQDDKALDALAGSDNGEVTDALEALRPYLGEGSWTDKDLE